MTEVIAREYVIQMGEIKVTDQPAHIICFGLGSCIGLFLFDRINKIAGGAHIMLHQYNYQCNMGSKLYYAEYALEALLKQMGDLGANISGLRAKLAGGAQVAGITAMHIGRNNQETTQSLLIKNNIYIAGSAMGGNCGRTARFNTCNGNVEITTEFDNYTI